MGIYTVELGEMKDVVFGKRHARTRGRLGEIGFDVSSLIDIIPLIFAFFAKNLIFADFFL